jgi:hypothetical protein
MKAKKEPPRVAEKRIGGDLRKNSRKKRTKTKSRRTSKERKDARLMSGSGERVKITGLIFSIV